MFTSNNNIKYITTKDIYKQKSISKKQNLEHKCILEESCKIVRRWQRYILLVKGGHCVEDWYVMPYIQNNVYTIIWHGNYLENIEWTDKILMSYVYAYPICFVYT